MIWHIFKKDLRLLWWLAAGIAALRFAEVAVVQSMGLFPVNPQLRDLPLTLAIGEILGVGFAICAVVHQDAIPGVRQDWLTRPIRRRDLLLAKFLFIVLLIQGPIFLGDLIQGVAAGFPIGASLAAAASRSIMLLLIVDIPFFAFASLTRNLLEAVMAGVLGFFLFAIFNVLLPDRFSSRPTWGTGEEWIAVTALAFMMCLGAAILLRLQFFRRRTRLARYLAGLFAVLSLCSTVMPWQPAFAVQRSLSPAPGSAAAIGVDFTPGAGKIRRDAGFPILSGNESSAFIYLPMRVSGLPDDSSLQSDGAQIQLSEAGGRAIAARPAFPWAGFRLSARRIHANPAGQDTYQTIPIPVDVYSRIKDRPVRLEIDYSLTLFTLASSHALPAVNGNEHLAGVGWCGTKINAAETAVQVSCEQAGRGPDCMTLVLEHVPTGLRNPERYGCDADYAPYRDWIFIPDGLARFGGNLAFRDINGLAKYPVNGSKLGESRVVMQIFRATDHFTRKLVIPEIRLSDWQAASTEE
ncbi:MAG TPA: hypothetical protein VIY49_22215 [Bryobacteraceae bacterium]